MKKMEKKFWTVTPFYFRFYICVQIFITIERIIKIFFFWGEGPLQHAKTLPSSSVAYTVFFPAHEVAGTEYLNKKKSILEALKKYISMRKSKETSCIEGLRKKLVYFSAHTLSQQG